jgi:DNA polymerase III subunit delta'
MTYRQIVGHRRIKKVLSSGVARGTMPPTLLFAGPHGVGKTLVARATASALNCLSPVRDRESLPIDACGNCLSCSRIARGVHVEVLQLEPDDRASIKIDIVRDMLERTGFRPFEGTRRVLIIRDADALEVKAQNALLKSLEEPPPASVFILTTAVPGALLPTVRSRCMRLPFGRLAAADVADVLVRDHGFTPSDARAVAGLAHGSVGQALAFGSTDLAVLRELALALLQHTARNRVLASRLQAAATIVTTPKKERSREDVGVILRLVASMLRDIELLNAGGDAHALANPAIAGELSELSRRFGNDRAREAFAAVDRAIAALEKNAGTKVVAEWLSANL